MDLSLKELARQTKGLQLSPNKKEAANFLSRSFKELTNKMMKSSMIVVSRRSPSKIQCNYNTFLILSMGTYHF